MAAVICGSAPVARAIDLERLVMPGPVIQGHADIESDCDQCHVRFSRERQRDLCMACHDDIATDLQASEGFHGRDAEASTAKCSSCHAEHEGRDADVTDLDTATFDHELTDFALIGKHGEADCKECHVPPAMYREASQVCVDCHEDDDEHEGGLGKDCADCHTSVDWLETTRFDHEDRTGYALFGGHADVRCAACHVEHRYENTPTECVACHRDEDPHEGGNGDDCAFCHTIRDWKEQLFDHEKETGFALLGQHGKIVCGDCHTGNKFDEPLQSECVSCHLDDDEHHGRNGSACGDCHTTDAWDQTTFDHATATAFALLGAHAETACEGCHTGPVDEFTPPTTCIGCHAEEDPHAGQEGEDCALCHSETDWTTRVAFDHGLTVFPLIGKHRDALCDDCHETRRFQDAAVECVECHREDDVHEQALGLTCGDCHNPNDWTFWQFDHAVQTRFALDGAHAELICKACHDRPLEQQQLEFGGCIACHRPDDVHRGEFGNDCERCHNSRSFGEARTPS